MKKLLLGVGIGILLTCAFNGMYRAAKARHAEKLAQAAEAAAHAPAR